MIRRFLDCLALARTVLVLSDRVSELSRRLRAEGERADRADRLADYYRAAEDRAIRVAVRAEERAKAAEQEELRGREARIGASHGINEERARVQKLAATYLRPVLVRTSPIDIEGSIRSFLDLL